MLGARIRSMMTGLDRPPTVAASAEVVLPPGSNTIRLSGAGTIAALIGRPIGAGRVVALIGDGGAAVTLANTDNASSAGAMDLGGADLELGSGEAVRLVQDERGAWTRLAGAAAGGDGEGKGGTGLPGEE